MSTYAYAAHPTDGFDSRLEADWAGLIRHCGLQWRREPFAIRRASGRTTLKNIVARPDFFLPDVAALFECKPTLEHVRDGEARWREEAFVTGLPVVVTAGYPQPEWVTLQEDYSEWVTETMRAVSPPRFEVHMPPAMWTFDDSGATPRQTYLAACPDCDRIGLAITSRSPAGWAEVVALENMDRAPVSAPLVDFWLSACRHQPKWSVSGLTTSIFDRRILLTSREGEMRRVMR